MKKYLVRRILHEDLLVEAESVAEAINKACNEDGWECYDARYSAELEGGLA